MREKIDQINQSIEEKRIRLKEKVERYFDAITVPSDAVTHQNSSTKKGNLPPVSCILYGIAGLSAIGAIATHSKVLCLCLTAASAFGGYKLSKTDNTSTTTISNNPNQNISSLKNEITSKVLDSVKKTTNEWESFMELKQKEIQAAIVASSLSDNQKDAMSSKIFVYEVIDISISEFSSKMNAVTSTMDMKHLLNSYKTKLLSAIDTAATTQVSKYNSLIQ